MSAGHDPAEAKCPRGTGCWRGDGGHSPRALLRGAVKPLGRRKAFERARWAAFDEPAGPDLDRFLALSRELEAMKEAAADDFQLSDADRLARDQCRGGRGDERARRGGRPRLR